MSREVKVSVKITCNSCGVYEKYVNTIAEGAEIAKPSTHPRGWLAITSDHHETVHYCSSCGGDIYAQIQKDHVNRAKNFPTDGDLEQMNKRLERSARGPN